MPQSLEQIQNNCKLARNSIERARKNGYAIGAFNLDNQETLIAVTKAAATKKAPVMVEISHGEVEMLGLFNVRDMVENYKREFGVEMYINLDHSPSVEAEKPGLTIRWAKT